MRTTKVCSKCGQSKQLKDFDNDKRYKNRKYCWCRACRSRQAALYNKLHPFKVRDTKLKSRYGITRKEYDEKVTDQEGVCAICSNVNLHKRALCVDHDHLTGEIRGLLCDKCNLTISFMHDNPFLLRKAAEYLEGK